MTSSVAQLVWLAGLGALVVLWARFRGRAGAAPVPVPRAEAAATVALVAALVAGGAAAWGGLIAEEGLARARAPAPGAPARARLFLRHVQLFFNQGLRATVGYGPTADLQLPRDYGLDEAGRSVDLFTLVGAGPRALTVEPLAAAGSTTRVLVAALPGGPEPGPALRRAVLDGHRCRAAAAAPALASADALTVFVLLCAGDEPRALLAFERELGVRDRPPGDTPLRVTPYVWRSDGFRPHHVHLEPGTLLQIGASADALPGVTVWEIPAPAGRPGLLFPPRNLLAPCSQWLEGNAAPDGGFFYPNLGVLAPAAPSPEESFACVLPFTPPFALEVRRLLPDTGGVWMRSLWASALLAVPVLCLLLLAALERGSARNASALARATGLAVVAVALAALATLRLLLAHRLDMMRDYEPAGARVTANLVETVLLAATLAAAAVAVGLTPKRRLAAAAAAWLAAAAVGAVAILPDLSIGPALLGQAAASLALGTAPAWWAVAATWRRPGWLTPPLAGLAALALVLAVTLAVAPHAVVVKLGAAWALPPLAYLALRDRRWTALLALADLALLARLDTGVCAIIAGSGLLVALLVVAGEALYVDVDARLLDAYSRQYRPLVVGQALALLALAGTLVLWAGLGMRRPDDAELPRAFTAAALHLLFFAAAVFAGAAALLWTRGLRRRALLWGGVSLVLVAGWAARGKAIDVVLASHSEASSRVAAIVDPGYALLANDRAFAKSLTAWRETASDAPLDTGAGTFGAQVLDPGVLLSIENDYLPVLLLREHGAGGILRLSLLSLGLALALWLVGAGRFAPGSASARTRRILALLLGLVCLYQPVASLGALPFTGISWPGLGIDSPSDLWIFVALLLFLAVLGDPAARPAAPAHVPLRARRLVAGAAAAVALAGALLVCRVAAFALRRHEPVEVVAAAATAEPTARLQAPFAGVEPVLDFVYKIQCTVSTKGLAPPLLGPAETPALARYQAALVATWASEQPAAEDELGRFRGGDRTACAGASGHWRFERKGGECRMTFKLGWPAVEYTADKDKLACRVDVAEDVLRAFRYPPRRPYAGERVRLVARAVGDAARDRGELVSGQVVVRLRPGAGVADAGDLRAGVVVAEKVRIGEDVEVALDGDVPTVRRGRGPAKLLVSARVHSLDEPTSRWETRVLDPGGAPAPLAALSVIVVGGTRGRNVWLFRPVAAHPGDPLPTVDPLLADDVTTVLGTRRRHYVYGGLVPELGWVNAGLVDKSLGLDGWTHAALARWERGTGGAAARSPTSDAGPSPQERFRGAMCGLLAPPAPDAAAADDAFARVCARSPLDGVLECRVALQPELEVRLRHLLELAAARPEAFAPPKLRNELRPLTNASFALVRGDTGEILAQAQIVPGRESTAYAPATPGLEKYLLAAREQRAETGAEKADWSQPEAIGSTMKPLLARALERAAPDATRAMVLTATAKRGGCQPILGHCPPTVTLWNHTEKPADYSLYLAESLNWFQAAVGLLGTALPDGELGFGDGPAQPLTFPFAVDKQTQPLWTRGAGRDVIRGATLDTAALRATPFWREFEALLGRPLCTGAKADCERAAERRDLCAARALPVDAPSADLRHLVAIGPSGFDFSDDGPAKPRQLVKDYLQLLRGSGRHPLASTLQLADAFNRLLFDGGGPPYKLVASWFPVAPAGAAPAPCSKGGGPATVATGLCRTLEDGTAAALAPRLADPDLVFYGAKTGTIDSLGDVAESRAACEAWNRAHTVAGAERQPYHLDCGSGRGELNDSLFVVGFGVKVGGGKVIPLTLALRFQRVGPTGYAVYAADAFLDVIADYLQ